MEYYKNLRGSSNIVKYQIGVDFIIIEFKDFKRYRYSYSKAGEVNVEEMKRLAVLGYGLNSFIRSQVKSLYDF